ncbi:MAG: helix-turn-helix transcriptional regulator [Planctomycetes bacterium]|nr:helix-turn-helix transcriptional regulator [Planctomycetota bacterium]
MSLRAAAAATGVSDRYILEIEQGRRNPSLGILERLAAGYGTTVGRLLRDAKIR